MDAIGIMGRPYVWNAAARETRQATDLGAWYPSIVLSADAVMRSVGGYCVSRCSLPPPWPCCASSVLLSPASGGGNPELLPQLAGEGWDGDEEYRAHATWDFASTFALPQLLWGRERELVRADAVI